MDDPFRYRIANILARQEGNLGTVWRATVESSEVPLPIGTLVGVKLLDQGRVDDERFRKLEQRSTALSSVHIPGLARHIETFWGRPPAESPLESGALPDQRYSVHEWVDGVPLQERAKTALPKEIVAWLQGAAQVLDAYHSHPAGPFAHRDLHPRNIVIDRSNRPVIIDHDTVLAGTAATTLVNRSMFAPSVPREGTRGAQEDDRLMLARTFLHALAGSPDAWLPLACLEYEATRRLSGHAADPAGVVSELAFVANGQSVRSARVLGRRASNAMFHRRRNRRAIRRIAYVWQRSLMPKLLAGGAAGVLAAAAAVIVLVRLSGTGASHPVMIAWSEQSPKAITITTSGFAPGSYSYSCYIGVPGRAAVRTVVARAIISRDPEAFSPDQRCHSGNFGNRIWVVFSGRRSNYLTAGHGTSPKPLPRPSNPPRSSISASPTTASILRAVTPSLSGTNPVGSTTPSSAAGAAVRTESVHISWSPAHIGWITMTLVGYSRTSYRYTCDFERGGDQSFTVPVASNPETIDDGRTCYDSVAGDSLWVTVGSATSNTIRVPAEAAPPPSAPPTTYPQSYPETTGGVTHTWSSYQNAGGREGPPIPTNQTVLVTCRVQGFQVTDGNTWWYKVASNPWNDQFYASADAFYNDGQTSGSLQGTPFYDPSVPVC